MASRTIDVKVHGVTPASISCQCITQGLCIATYGEESCLSPMLEFVLQFDYGLDD